MKYSNHELNGHLLTPKILKSPRVRILQWNLFLVIKLFMTVIGKEVRADDLPGTLASHMSLTDTRDESEGQLKTIGVQPAYDKPASNRGGLSE